jgi:hypothetical protein
MYWILFLMFSTPLQIHGGGGGWAKLYLYIPFFGKIYDKD